MAVLVLIVRMILLIFLQVTGITHPWRVANAWSALFRVCTSRSELATVSSRALMCAAGAADTNLLLASRKHRVLENFIAQWKRKREVQVSDCWD